jgi:hypothetical protein
MFRLYLSHLQALKGHIHTISEQCIIHGLYGSDPRGPEDDSQFKHVVLLMYYSSITYVSLLCFD